MLFEEKVKKGEFLTRLEEQEKFKLNKVSRQNETSSKIIILLNQILYETI